MVDVLLIMDCQILRFYNPRINYGLCCLYTNIAGFTKIMTIATSKYIMVYKSACVCKLRSFTQKRSKE